MRLQHQGAKAPVPGRSSAVYHYQCLDFKFEFKVFYFRAKPETQFKFSLGLGNIGKTTDFLGGMEF